MRHMQGPAGRLGRALVAPLVAGGMLTGLGSAAASTAACQSWTGGQPPSPGTVNNELDSVVVLSPCNAWAVGVVNSSAAGADQTLIEHWDGTSWTVVPSPSPAPGESRLLSVRAISPANIWAVGSVSQAITRTLIEHWDGSAWTVVPSPSPSSSYNALNGVRAISRSDAWAVGFFTNGLRNKTLILHWNGTTWKQVKSPNPGQDNGLTGVAATSHGNVWAVGTAANNDLGKTLILHWSGARWIRVPSPSPGSSNALTGVGARPATGAWAVGFFDKGGTRRTLILRWTGRRWTQTASPSPGSPAQGNVLTGVTAISARNVWAVGAHFNGHLNGTVHKALILRWNGRRWIRATRHIPGSASDLFAVAASSAGNVWAVGSFSNGPPAQALAVHCC